MQAKEVEKKGAKLKKDENNLKKILLKILTNLRNPKGKEGERKKLLWHLKNNNE